MAKETIDAVKQAEENAQKRELDAAAECQQIFDSAQEEKKRLLETLTAEAKGKYEQMVATAQQEAALAKEAAAKNAQAQVHALQQKASTNMSAAVDAVIARIL